MKIATWNVNSLRVRLPHLLTWLAEAKPDVVALQETKILDKDFPFLELQQAGYYSVYNGQKTYNGVALLSRSPIANIMPDIPGFSDEQRRVLGAKINDVFILNLYVPNGSVVGSDKYQYKLNWLIQLTNYLKELIVKQRHLVILGDFNIAPDDRDVHDPKLWAGQVLVSELERQFLKDITELGLLDAFRLFEQGVGHYSWWDYRAAAFRRNLGLRIDHILISSTLSKHCTNCTIDKLPRTWERPSDHAPVIATFDL